MSQFCDFFACNISLSGHKIHLNFSCIPTPISQNSLILTGDWFRAVQGDDCSLHSRKFIKFYTTFTNFVYTCVTLSYFTPQNSYLNSSFSFIPLFRSYESSPGFDQYVLARMVPVPNLRFRWREVGVKRGK